MQQYERLQVQLNKNNVVLNESKRHQEVDQAKLQKFDNDIESIEKIQNKISEEKMLLNQVAEVAADAGTPIFTAYKESWAANEILIYNIQSV